MFSCAIYPNFPTRYLTEVNFHVVIRHISKEPKINHKYELCKKTAGLFFLRLPTLKIHNGESVPQQQTQICKRQWKRLAMSVWWKKWNSARSFLWNWLWRFRDPVEANNKMDLTAWSRKLDTVFVKLDFAAKKNVAFALMSKNVEYRSYPCYYAYKNMKQNFDGTIKTCGVRKRYG